VRDLLKRYPRARRVHLVLDNLNTHNARSLTESFGVQGAKPLLKRIVWHQTPKHASWLNMAEIEISVLTEQCLRRRLAELGVVQREAAVWSRDRNRRQATICWTFDHTDARRVFPERYRHKLCAGRTSGSLAAATDGVSAFHVVTDEQWDIERLALELQAKDDLAFGVTGVQSGHRLLRLGEREDPVDDHFKLLGIDDAAAVAAPSRTAPRTAARRPRPAGGRQDGFAIWQAWQVPFVAAETWVPRLMACHPVSM
jgi:hypothetical protein